MSQRTPKSRSSSKAQAPNILIFGAGGLGHPVCFFLTRNSTLKPKLTICDGDTIQRSNLNRQFLFREDQIGSAKASSLAAALEADCIVIESFPPEEEMRALIAGADYVIDATDSIRNKFLCNDLCVELIKPYSYAGVIGERGAFLEVQPGGPCLRCVFGDYTDEDFSKEQASCQSAGIVGAVCGMFGALIASAVENYFAGTERPPELIRFDPAAGIQFAPVRPEGSCRCRPL